MGMRTAASISGTKKAMQSGTITIIIGNARMLPPVPVGSRAVRQSAARKPASADINTVMTTRFFILA